MAKSITAGLTGFMVADGRLSLDGPAPVAGWQRSGDPRGAIRLGDLLHMASGIDYLEEGDPVWKSDRVTMLLGGGAQDMAGLAAAKTAGGRPGEGCIYSSANRGILEEILDQTEGG